MSRILLILSVCLSLSACEQTKIEKGDISNTKTARHINIPGTRLYLIPPTDFKIANSFSGLQKNGIPVLQIQDLVGGNYYTNAATFTKEEFEKRGVKVFQYRELKVNGFPAKYVIMQGDPKTKNIGLVFGDSTFSTMVTAIYPSFDSHTEEEIESTINTIYYDKNVKFNALAIAPFTLDESKSIFKFYQSAGGMFLYTIGGQDNQSKSDRPVVTITPVPGDASTTAKDVSEMVVSSLEKYGLTDKVLKNISAADVNGQPAYEVEVYGKMKGKSCLIYLLVVNGQDKACSIQGLVTSNFDENLKEIRYFARTIKLK